MAARQLFSLFLEDSATRSAVRPGGPPCLRCRSDTFVGPGKGPHYAEAICIACRARRWLPKDWQSRLICGSVRRDNLKVHQQKRPAGPCPASLPVPFGLPGPNGTGDPLEAEGRSPRERV